MPDMKVLIYHDLIFVIKRVCNVMMQIISDLDFKWLG